MTASEIWQEMPTNDRTELIERYGVDMLPYYLQKPSEKQIIRVLSDAKKAGYLITSFTDYQN